ncbi:DivIVA domain-containing protein [Streptomycetaceae bacterium NBC_01309]
MTDKFPGFDVVRRGYDRGEVDRFLRGCDGGPLGDPRFTIARRGYDPFQVEEFLATLRAGGEPRDTDRPHPEPEHHRA